jgi:hypothetical protein
MMSSPLQNHRRRIRAAVALLSVVRHHSANDARHSTSRIGHGRQFRRSAAGDPGDFITIKACCLAHANCRQIGNRIAKMKTIEEEVLLQKQAELAIARGDIAALPIVAPGRGRLTAASWFPERPLARSGQTPFPMASTQRHFP